MDAAKTTVSNSRKEGGSGAPGIPPRKTRRTLTFGNVFGTLGKVFASIPVLIAALFRPKTSAALREKVFLGVTSVNDCRYCSWGHSHWALAQGVSLEEVNQILGQQMDELVARNPAEAAAILFAQHYAEYLESFEPESVENLRQFYSEAQIAEILGYVRLITFGNLLGNSLDALIERFRGARHLSMLLSAVLAVLSGAAHAAAELGESDVAKANNPLASATAFNIHNYYIGELTGTNEPGNQFWLRAAKPFSIGESNWLMRASLPVNTYPVPPELNHETGLGDFNAFAAYLIDVGNPRISFGVGPLIAAPTATDDDLGSGKWSAGIVNILFNGSSPRFQYGYLLTWQTSFAGSDNRPDVNAGAFQPILIYQLGGGTYLRSTPIMTYDFEDETYSVPLGLGIGKVWKSGTTTCNLFVEPQWSVADEGAGWPEWQVFTGLNLIFN